MLNGCSAVVLEDIVKRIRPGITQTQGAVIAKITALVIGLISVALVLFARHAGSGMLTVGSALSCSDPSSLMTFNSEEISMKSGREF